MGTKVFYIWGTTCFCCIIFAYFCIPETKGLSLEQIDVLYQNVVPVNSVSYRKRLLAEGTELSEPKEAAPATSRNDDLHSNEKAALGCARYAQPEARRKLLPLANHTLGTYVGCWESGFEDDVE